MHITSKVAPREQMDNITGSRRAPVVAQFRIGWLRLRMTYAIAWSLARALSIRGLRPEPCKCLVWHSIKRMVHAAFTMLLRFSGIAIALLRRTTVFAIEFVAPACVVSLAVCFLSQHLCA
jgi:hypothetical protein